jgi:uncharacterized membrane protein
MFTFVLPGYAITAALYPAMYRPLISQPPSDEADSPEETGDSETGSADDTTAKKASYPLSPAEGLALSVGLSIAAVPLTVLLVSFSSVEISPQATLGAVAVVTAVTSIGAAFRRTRGTRNAGFSIKKVTEIVVARFGAEPSIRSSAEVITVVLLLLSAGIAGAALTDTRGGERYTELSLLTEDAETGNLTADDYPTTLQVGDPTELVVSVGNHEGEITQYTIVIQLQSVSTSEGERTVTRANTLNQFSLTIADNNVTRRPTAITVDAVAEADRHRVAVLLYKGDPPTNPTVSNSYREVHIWTSVSQ